MDLNMLNKILAIILSISVPCSAIAAETSTGTFSLLKKGDKAQFDGVLFDPYATGTIVSEGETLEDKYKLDLKYELDKINAQHKLDLDNLNITLKTNSDTSKTILESKDKEIKGLQDIALHSNDYTLLYVGGGFLAGILITIGVLWATGNVKSNQ